MVFSGHNMGILHRKYEQAELVIAYTCPVKAQDRWWLFEKQMTLKVSVIWILGGNVWESLGSIALLEEICKKRLHIWDSNSLTWLLVYLSLPLCLQINMLSSYYEL